MFGERLLSSVILMIITITTIVLGGPVLMVTLTLISFMGLFELFRTLHIEKSWMAIAGYLSCLIFDCMVFFEKEEYMMQFLVITFIIIMSIYVIWFPVFNSEHATLVFFGVFYVPVLLSYVYKVRGLEEGFILVWLVFIGAWGSDTCAYCVGKLIGKHKLPSQLSPKKTIEGCLGGIVGASLMGFIFASVLKGQNLTISNPQLSFAIIGGASAVLSQIGDLAASAIKRNTNVKDYGKLIPGHGGILDRFDSIIFIAPVVYYLIKLL